MIKHCGRCHTLHQEIVRCPACGEHGMPLAEETIGDYWCPHCGVIDTSDGFDVIGLDEEFDPNDPQQARDYLSHWFCGMCGTLVEQVALDLIKSFPVVPRSQCRMLDRRPLQRELFTGSDT